MPFPKSSSEWLNVNNIIAVCLYARVYVERGTTGVGRERGRREREEREQCHENVFDCKWLLASNCPADPGNLNRSAFGR